MNYKSILPAIILPIVASCAHQGMADDVYFGIRVVGDDALTSKLVDSIQRGRKGFRYLPSENWDDRTLVVFITTNVEYTEKNGRGYVEYSVEYIRGGGTISSANGMCPEARMSICRDAILNGLATYR